MKRPNPLFVDSTKFHGDLVLTRLQLRAFCVEQDVQFVAEVVRSFSNEEIAQILLVCDEDDHIWRGQIHLEHLESVEVTPVMLNASGERTKGPRSSCLGMHVIDLQWGKDDGAVSAPSKVDDSTVIRLE